MKYKRYNLGSDLAVIKLLSSSFVIVLQNCPIRTQYLLDMTLSLDGFLEYEYTTIIVKFYERKTWLKMETIT